MYNGILGTNLLRGILALAVALHHADIFGLGYFPLIPGRSAVIGFFVLSGWVTAWFFYHTKDKITKAIAIEFWIRRFYRLSPVLILNFILVCLIMKKVMAWELIGLLPVFWVSPPKFFNHVLWTLFVEIQFYLILPLLIRILGQRLSKITDAFCFYVFIFILPRMLTVLWGGSIETAFDDRSLLGNLCFFYVGVWYARTVCCYQDPFKNYSRAWLLILSLLFMIGSGLLYAFSPILFGLIGVHGAVLATVFFIGFSRLYKQDFVLLPYILKIVYGLGVISFGYYVYHGLCLGVIENKWLEQFGFKQINIGSGQATFIIVIIPMILATCSYLFIEKHLMKVKLSLLKKGKN